MKLKHICTLSVLLAAGVMILGVCQSWRFLHKPLSDSKIILRMAVPYADAHPSTLTASYFADLVRTRTDDRIQIQVFPNTRLGNESETIEQLEFGGIAFSIVCTLALEEEYVISAANPLSDQPEHTVLLLPDKNALDHTRLETLAVLYPDLRCIANNKYPLKVPVPLTPENQKRLVIQAHDSDLLKRHLTALGVLAVQSQEKDLAGSLNYGYIDGIELTLAEYTASNLSGLLPYLSVTEGLLAPDMILASQVSMGNLTAADQNIIRSCAADAAAYQEKILKGQQTSALKALQPLYLNAGGSS